MHILTFILIFIVGSIAAAMKGDYSGIEAIVQFMIAAVEKWEYSSLGLFESVNIYENNGDKKSHSGRVF